MQLVMCGIPRSGSTMVWQILREVFLGEQDILQTHPGAWEPTEGTFAVVTIRDPRDVAASRYRVRLSRAGVASGGPVDLEAELHVMKEMFDGAKRILQSPSVLLRYEDFWDNRNTIYEMIETHLGKVVKEEQRKRIDRLYGLEANQRRAAALPSFLEYDEDKIHGDHIGPVIPGSWKQVLPEWAVEMVSIFCKPLLEEWGYA